MRFEKRRKSEVIYRTYVDTRTKYLHGAVDYLMNSWSVPYSCMYIICSSFFCLAIPGEDYEEVLRQELVFAPRNTAICIDIQVYADDVVESTETFTVSLTTAVEDSTVVIQSVHKATVQIFDSSSAGEEVAN